MATIGVSTGLACVLLDVPGALLLGLISAVTEAIPLVGPILGAIPAVLMAATVSPELALVIAGVYLVLQARERSVAQDPAAIDSEDDEHLENAPDTPGIGTTPSVAPPSVVTQGR